MDVIIPSLFRMQCILSPSGVLPNIGLIKTLAENAGIDVWSMVPSLADELGEAPGVLAKFKSSKFICVSGGKHFDTRTTSSLTDIPSPRSGQSIYCNKSQQGRQGSQLDRHYRGSIYWESLG